MNKWTRLFFQPNLPLYERKYVTASSEHIRLAKEAAEEGIVLLKNENHLFPLQKGCRIALFGKGSFDYVKGGGGSGDVNAPEAVNLYEGLTKVGMNVYEPLSDFYRQNVSSQYASGAVPGMTEEPIIPASLLSDARNQADTALIVISRYSGEGWDRDNTVCKNEYNPWPDEGSLPETAARIFPNGDFWLTDAERKMVGDVTGAFSRTAVLLNIGGVIDTSWIRDNAQIASAMLIWQGGMEGGTAAAELIAGEDSPSGKLPDSFASPLKAYPSAESFEESMDYVRYTEDVYVGYRYFETVPGAKDRVVYPFGFGLSYTSFTISCEKTVESSKDILFSVSILNTGNTAGREVIQLYVQAPQGKIGRPSRELKAFAKTEKLRPGKQQTLVLTVNKASLAAFDDTGRIQESAYVLEKGSYFFYLGNSVRHTKKLSYTLEIAEDIITEQLSRKAAPNSLPQRMRADGSFEELPVSELPDMNACIFEKMVPGTEEALAPASCARRRHLLMENVRTGVSPLIDAADGKITEDEFLSQLSTEELIGLCGGQPNLSVANTFGFGNLPEFGIPSVMTADGPSGIRLSPDTGIMTTAWPCPSCISSSWDQDLAEMVGRAGGEELKENNLAVWLTPAVNIHRNPLCGRNFEYYSEDPFLSGKMGAAMVRGIQLNGVAACPKHFVCNNKETNRKHSDSRVSERALREIYLKPFEIIVKEAGPWVLMSSYNAVNGCRVSENKDLLDGILREEWHYTGLVTSDWWNRAEQYKEILAGNDVKMAAGFPERVLKALEMGVIDRNDIERCAKRVIDLILKLD